MSCATTVMFADPFAFDALVYVSVPLLEIAGCTLNSALLSFVTVNVTVWLASSAVGPALMPEA